MVVSLNKICKIIIGWLIASSSIANPLLAETSPISGIVVRGNAKVEKEAILAVLSSKKGQPFDEDTARKDIRNLYDLGYFSNIAIFREKTSDGLRLIIEVKEKPAISGIVFRGLDEISEDKLREQLTSKPYSIVNRATIADDLQMIERQYAEKGFYLVDVSYQLQQKGDNEVVLEFTVNENSEVRIGTVTVQGNNYFSDRELIDKMALRATSRIPTFRGVSNFQEELLERDVGFLLAYYKDYGFAEAKVAQPLLALSQDRQVVHITYEVEEGRQYRVSDIEFSGDLLFPIEELQQKTSLHRGDLFRLSRFRRDIETLMDTYGDLGYAYANVEPLTELDRQNRQVKIDYRFSKGEKVYIGNIDIVGNTKTRDNVIRRELEIYDSELYSGTKVNRSKTNIERLGFFESVQVNKERAEDNLLNLRVKVKERPTGQLQAAIMFTPGGSSTQSGWAGQGRYDEKNQSGKGWQTNVTGKWDGRKNYRLSLGFANPRVNDSHWSLGTSAFFSREGRRYINSEFIEERRYGGTLTVGRRLFELVRASLSYKLQHTQLETDTFILERFREEGISSGITFALSRNATNDVLEPSAGSSVSLQQTVTGGAILRGDSKYMETSLDASYYYPFKFTDGFRTYIKLRGLLSHIYPYGDTAVPFMERYRLGGSNDMRGFPYWSIGPKFYVLRSPVDSAVSYNRGGNKKLLMQLEYFIPLIHEARIKAILFSDTGRVYDDNENLSLTDLYHDVGFGIRWVTPIAPLRFEWAFPLENGKIGDLEFIFSLGY